MIQVKIKRLHPNAKMPIRAYATDSGYDLHSIEDFHVYRNMVTKVHTGIAVEIPIGYEGQIRPRSGLALNYGLTVVNSPGTIDSGYRGEIIVLVTLIGDCCSGKFRADQRIAQLVIQKLPEVELVEVEELAASERDSKGFGSTGIDQGEPVSIG
jgi:deoxyuridine 5''-triphosphate nucleotidohydrolase (dut)